MQDLVMQFLNHLAADGVTPPNTIHAYRTDLTQLIAFLDTQQIKQTDQLTPAAMQHFCDWLHSQGYAAATIARRVTALRAFGAFLVECGSVSTNPGSGITPPIRTRVPRPQFTQQQLLALCEAPLHRPCPEGWRDHALLQVLIGTGLRASTVASINVADVNLEDGQLRVREGSRAGRTVKLSCTVVMALATYLMLGRPHLVGEHTQGDALFVNQRGQRLTRQGCWVVVKQYARQLALNDVSLERLRLPGALPVHSSAA